MVISLQHPNRRAHAQAGVAGGAFLHGDPGGVAFGQNATTLNFLLTRAVSRLLEPGDEIITTTLDHDANVAPVLARDRGLTVRQVGVTADLSLMSRIWLGSSRTGPESSRTRWPPTPWAR